MTPPVLSELVVTVSVVVDVVVLPSASVTVTVTDRGSDGSAAKAVVARTLTQTENTVIIANIFRTIVTIL